MKAQNSRNQKLTTQLKSAEIQIADLGKAVQMHVYIGVCECECVRVCLDLCAYRSKVRGVG